ncbi:hypothetical protein EYF80_001033 [Liparis tanakae]|uniref:Uncharacterized protein n=1 Tax=Liparis tanakae TaxID=230148 RepID=A0A4Z2JF99_9TELE|nr:hypothetical protein EYF80_001033 [Liparis tanakae]
MVKCMEPCNNNGWEINNLITLKFTQKQNGAECTALKRPTLASEEEGEVNIFSGWTGIAD